MNGKILTENGLVDEALWDKLRQFSKGKQPGPMGRYMQSVNRPTQPAPAPVSTPQPAPAAQPPVIQKPVAKPSGLVGNYMQGYNKPEQQPVQASQKPVAKPPVIPKPTTPQPYTGPTPPVIPPPKPAATTAVPPAIPTQGMSLNTTAGTFGVNLTSPSAAPAATAPQTAPPVIPQPAANAPIKMNKNVSFDVQRGQTKPKQPAAKAAKQTPQTSKPAPKTQSNVPLTRGKLGTYQLEETITKEQLKDIIKNVAKVLKESQ